MSKVKSCGSISSFCGRTEEKPTQPKLFLQLLKRDKLHRSGRLLVKSDLAAGKAKIL